MLLADILFYNKFIAGTIIYREIILSLIIYLRRELENVKTLNSNHHPHQNHHHLHPLARLDRHQP